MGSNYKQQQLLQRAKYILQTVQAEKITSIPHSPGICYFRRLVALAVKNQPLMINPGLTTVIATTYCGVGLCQELAQRAIFEYCLRYKENSVGLIFFMGANHRDSHAVAFLGDIAVDEKLKVGKGCGVVVDPQEALPIKDFFTQNPDLIIIDPFLNLVGTERAGDLQALFEYCKNNNITGMLGVRDFSQTPNFLAALPTVGKNALEIAEKIKQAHLSKKASRYATADQPYGPFKDQYSFPPDFLLKDDPRQSSYVGFPLKATLTKKK